jgi:hypothetical protein
MIVFQSKRQSIQSYAVLEMTWKTSWCVISPGKYILLVFPGNGISPAGHSPFNDFILWDVRPVAQITVNPEDARATEVAVPVAVTGLMFMTGWQTCPSATLRVPAGSLR